MPDRNFYRGMFAGVAGGMVAGWAVNRFYNLARRSSETNSIAPYLLGAGIGVTYAAVIQRQHMPLLARVPLGAAIYLGEPEKTAAPLKGGRDLSEKTRNFALRMASRGLKKAAEKAFFA